MASAPSIDEMIEIILRAIDEYPGAGDGDIFPLGGVHSTLIERGHDDNLVGVATEEMYQRGLLEKALYPMTRLTQLGISTLSQIR
jgi:hypothetical protein